MPVNESEQGTEHNNANVLESYNASVVQRIEQSRPKGLMWVQFLPEAQNVKISHMIYVIFLHFVPERKPAAWLSCGNRIRGREVLYFFNKK